MSFQAIPISENVYFVGAIDYNIRNFHGYETRRGTTYNAYLVLDRKNDEAVLIDTVKKEFFPEMLERIKSVISLDKIKTIISNHAEMDHTGALLDALSVIHPNKIFASKVGVATLKKLYFNDDSTLAFSFSEIKSGDSYKIGSLQFLSLETRMLHWPDSMFTYFVNDKILFSQDAFGMHMAFDHIFADDNEQSILAEEGKRYFANILMPYTSLVANLLKKLPSFNLDIQILAPDHGPIFRQKNDISFIINLWDKWANFRHNPKALIIYDTMWKSTEKMARSISEGFRQKNIDCSLIRVTDSHRTNIATEALDANFLLVGTPTINKEMFPTIADILCYLKGLHPKIDSGLAFGSHGWGIGEGVNFVEKILQEMKINVLPAIKANYIPTSTILDECFNVAERIL